MATIHSIQGGGKVLLHVREWGDVGAPPILFIHGWSASHLAWRYQYESALAEAFRLVALDLRGHGMSEAPRDAASYADPRLWADDLAAVIDGLELVRPLLVGWSYGGFVVSDYLRIYGQSNLSGVNFVGGAVTFRPDSLEAFFGPGFLRHVEGATQPDLPTSIEAMRQFVHELVARPMVQDDLERVLGFNFVVPALVRAALIAREIDSDDVLRNMTVPVLVTHGREDRHVLPAMAEHILETCPTATASWYEGAAHMPFMETPERFNNELADFARGA